MQNNYHFLSYLSQEIAKRLHVEWQNNLSAEKKETSLGAMELRTCFSQNKDELILGFANDQEEFYMRASLNADFAGLSFPSEFQRAKKNSVDLFAVLIDVPIVAVRQYTYERCFAIVFANDMTLLFKMHGRRSNVVLFEKNEFVISFHKKMENDQHIDLLHLDKNFIHEYTHFEAEKGLLTALYPTFGKEIGEYLEEKNYYQLDILARFELVSRLLKELEKGVFYVSMQGHLPELTLFKPLQENSILLQTQNPIQAANEFFYAYTRLDGLQKEKAKALKELHKKKKQSNNYIQNNQQKLKELTEGANNEETAHLIMANLHLINPQQDQIEVFDFYKNKNRTIKLKKDISPQKNAEIYYRKAKNEKIEIKNLEDNILAKEKELKIVEKHLHFVEHCAELKELKKYLKNNQLSAQSQAQEHEEQLFRKFFYLNYHIYVGKNAKNNDLLLQKSYKEDLWLHAKDVSGSHVIIKHQSGRNFPKEVILKAASLAAYYSKRSNDSLCPVIVTPRKFVRKTKDLNEGQVIVDREEVIMVIPESF